MLDTHALVWRQAKDPPTLSSRAYDVIANPGNTVFVSAASIWEISIERAQGKLNVPGSLLEALEDNGFRELPITAFHVEQAGSLPMYHTDPV